MAWQFRRSVKVFPGVKLNIGKRSVSMSIGGRGGHINIGKDGTYITGGIPGSGLYYREKIGPGYGNRNMASSGDNPINIEQQEYQPVKICSLPPTTLDSQSLGTVKITISEIIEQKSQIQREIKRLEWDMDCLKVKSGVSKVPLLGSFLIKNQGEIKQRITELESDLSEAKQCYEDSFLDVDIDIEPEYLKLYEEVVKTFHQLITSNKKWKILSTEKVNKFQERSSANKFLNRTLVNVEYKDLHLIKSRYSALQFNNPSGASLYLYPAFLLVMGGEHEFGLVDIRDLEVDYYVGNFHETGTIPPDAPVVGKTWLKVNKDGTPDQRFQNNYEIPICKYGYIHFKSESGLNELFSFSNPEFGKKFGLALSLYQKRLSSEW